MKLNMIAVDLDGTLLGGTEGRYGFLPEGLAALREAAGEDTLIAIVTGRDLTFILELLTREGVSPVQEGWPHVIIAEERYIYYLQDKDYVPDAVWNESVYDSERSQFHVIRQGISDLLGGELFKVDATSYRVEGDIEERRGFVEIRLSDANAARAGEMIVLEWLRRKQLSYTTVRNVAGVAIRHASVGKGPVLALACKQIHIPASGVLAVGDSSNDLSMFAGSWGFISAAPGNAELEVKEKVRENGGYIADGICGRGVAEAIFHYRHKT